jgi:formylglycine-generating enzyme required for sulfatase activity
MAPRRRPSADSASKTVNRGPRRKLSSGLAIFILALVLIAGGAFAFARYFAMNGDFRLAILNALNLGALAGTETEEIKSVPDSGKVIRPGPSSNVVIYWQPPADPAPVTSIAPDPVRQAQLQALLKPAASDNAPAVDKNTQAISVPPDPPPRIEVKSTVASVALVTEARAAFAPANATHPPLSEGQIFRDCEICPELVMVAPGSYLVGSGDGGTGRQGDVISPPEVTIKEPYAIGRYEITFDDWDRCVSAGGCTKQPSDDGWGRGRRPVIHVSFHDISGQFLPWLSRVTGRTYRLPAEAEWEYAARGGASALAGMAYSFGNNARLICEYGNSSDLSARTVASAWAGAYCNDRFATTAPVGSLKPNSLGLFDVHGNVWEWVADCWRPELSVELASTAESCKFRVLRGGSWASDGLALLSAFRGWERPSKSGNSIGFRVARSQP